MTVYRDKSCSGGSYLRQQLPLCKMPPWVITFSFYMYTLSCYLSFSYSSLHILCPLQLWLLCSLHVVPLVQLLLRTISCPKHQWKGSIVLSGNEWGYNSDVYSICGEINEAKLCTALFIVYLLCVWGITLSLPPIQNNSGASWIIKRAGLNMFS